MQLRERRCACIRGCGVNVGRAVCQFGLRRRRAHRRCVSRCTGILRRRHILSIQIAAALAAFATLDGGDSGRHSRSQRRLRRCRRCRRRRQVQDVGARLVPRPLCITIGPLTECTQLLESKMQLRSRRQRSQVQDHLVPLSCSKNVKIVPVVSDGQPAMLTRAGHDSIGLLECAESTQMQRVQTQHAFPDQR